MDKWLNNLNVIRIAALFLAILLWVVVHMDQQPPASTQPQKAVTKMEQELFEDVQITALGLDEENAVIRSVDPGFVNVEVRGLATDLNKIRLQNQRFQVVVDVTDLGAGVHNDVPLTAVGFPSDVDVTIQPAAVNIQIEEIVRKEVSVQVEVTGKPAQGYRAGEAIVHPSRVYVVLPRDEIDVVSSVRAQVDITDANKKVSSDPQLIAFNIAGEVIENVQITPAVVNVEIPITSPFKTIPLQLRLVGEPPDGFSIAAFKQNASEVTIYGPEEILNQYHIYQNIEVDLSLLTSSKTLTIPIPLRDNLSQVFPTEILVDVEVVPTETRLIEAVPLILTGESQEAETRIVEPEDGTIDVLVSGAPSLLKNITQDDIQAIVDVSNLPPGNHSPTIKFNLPQFIKWVEDETLNVNILIEQEKEVTFPEQTEDETPEESVSSAESEQTEQMTSPEDGQRSSVDGI